MRGLINRQMPQGAVRLVEGIAPREGEDGSDEWFGWMFMGDAIPGLSASDSPARIAIWLRASDAMGARGLAKCGPRKDRPPRLGWP